MNDTRTLITTRYRNASGESAITQYPGLPAGVPGLAIAVTQWGNSVIHTRSGIAVGTYPDPEVALAAAIEFGKVLDWTIDGESLRIKVKKLTADLMPIIKRYAIISGIPPSATERRDLPK